MGYVDFHVHLDFPDFSETRDQLIHQCFQKGFSRLVTVADPVELDSLDTTGEILTAHDNVYAVAGVHPHHADQYNSKFEQQMIQFLSRDRVIGLGEIGLDFHYNYSAPQRQKEVLSRQLQVARELQVPAIIHSRNAEAEVLAILAEIPFDQPVVFHCYTGNLEMAKEIIKRQYAISFSGIVTFKKADYLREIAATVPLSQIFTETDSPFLSPEPFRGKPNSPLRVELVARKIAEIKGMAVADLNQAVNENLERLFPL